MNDQSENNDDHQPTTKDDVRSAVDELAQMTAQSFTTVATKDELTAMENRLVTVIKQEASDTRALVEEVREDVGGANKDEMSLIKDQKIPDHEERITALEGNTGLT